MKRCLKCSGETAVKDVLPMPDGIYRKRVCKGCNEVGWTAEKPCDPPSVKNRRKPTYHDGTRRAAALAGIPISHFWLARQNARWRAEERGIPPIKQYEKENILTLVERQKLGMEI